MTKAIIAALVLLGATAAGAEQNFAPADCVYHPEKVAWVCGPDKGVQAPGGGDSGTSGSTGGSSSGNGGSSGTGPGSAK